MSREPAIIGLGMTPMSVKAGPDSFTLAAEAVGAALSDAGLERGDADGLLVGSSQGVRPDRLSVTLARRAGLGDLRLLEHLEIKGCTAVAMVTRAVLAIRAGMARTVICVFADAPISSGKAAGSLYAHSGGNAGVRGLERASGVLGSVPTYALLASRFLHETGGTEADLCAVATSARAWAAGSPEAVNRKPLDDEGYYASRMISAPLRVLDCARPVNGAVAVIVSAERPAGGDRAGADRAGADRAGADQPGAGHGTPAITIPGMGAVHPMRRRRAGGESWFGGGGAAVDDALAMAGITRAELDVAELYDPFTIVTLCLLEEYGLCAPGQAGKFVRGGGIAPGGELPVNTGGGQLSGFYLQGMTPLAEAVIQLRGDGGDRQVAGTRTALVTGIGGRIDHHEALVLTREAA
ncbi:MAG TPA: thiolase family protein [Trebonia sp.]|jgi:acetyl-CoA acetyltransferase